MNSEMAIDLNVMQFCTFRIEHRLFGINIVSVKEINHEINYTPIAHTHPAVKGYMNLRGQIVLLICLRNLLGYPEVQLENQSVIFFKTSLFEFMGIIVDEVGDITKVDISQIEFVDLCKKSSINTEIQHINSFKAEKHKIAHELIKGACKLQNELMMILDEYKIIPAFSKNDLD
ncbi:MAG: purine-binding chemotaxis protein CheW [Oligoflexales bacterium]|nr:purine-binding chemotaxis protein CheW [Oligoflexales bacterium]